MMNQSTRRHVRLLVRLGAVALGLMLGTPTAFAGGYDMPGSGGARGVGRAGAFSVRADAATALQLNPANLARLSGINVELNIAAVGLNLCFDRLGTPTRNGTLVPGSRASESNDANGAGGRSGNVTEAFGAPSSYAEFEYPEVCNGAGLVAVPQLALTFRPHERVGLAVGLIAPSNAGSRSFGGTSGEELGTQFVPEAGRRLPTSSRYDLIAADVILATLAVGVGIELHPRLRLGASLGWGFASLNFTTSVPLILSEDIARDIMTTAEASDFFVPRVAMSLAAEPVDGFELMAGFVWTQNIKASGDLYMRPLYWGNLGGQLFPNPPGPISPETPSEELEVSFPANITAPQTASITVGGRYAMARPGAYSTTERALGLPAPTGADGVSRPFDPLRDELFDVELNVTVTLSNRVDDYDVVTQEVEGRRLVTGALPPLVPPQIGLTHNWKTQVSVALGGDVNVIPEAFALRWGLVYESHGVEEGYERLDFTPWQLMGGSLGMTMRVKRFELSAGYLYIHYFDITNDESRAQLQAPVAVPPGPIINSGTLQASVHILSLGLSYRFQ